jgi:hypothetical protein
MDATSILMLSTLREQSFLDMNETVRRLKAELADFREGRSAEARLNAQALERLANSERELRRHNADLEVRLARAQEEAERLERVGEQSVSSTRAELNAQLEALRRELTSRDIALQRLEDWRLDREALLADNAALKETVTGLKKDHERDISMLERRNTADREALRQLLLNHLREAKHGLLAKTASALDDTSKRICSEQEQLMEELAYTCKRAEDLAAENATLIKVRA